MATGGGIVLDMLCHWRYVLDNVVPHERYPLGMWLTKQALRQGHGFVAQSEQVRRELLALLPEITEEAVRLAPHPVYDYSAPQRPRPTRAEARRQLTAAELKEPDRADVQVALAEFVGMVSAKYSCQLACPSPSALPSVYTSQPWSQFPSERQNLPFALT